ncbi:hypothetical protein VPH35_005477 [Triticum aestivum]
MRNRPHTALHNTCDKQRNLAANQTMDHSLLLLLASLAAVAVAAVWHLRSHGRRTKLPLPPGPRGWPVLGNLPQLGAMPHHTMAALARQHGPLFRLRFGSVEVVVTASAKVARSFLRAHDTNFSDRPPTSGAEHLAYNYQDLVFAPYGARWCALRKLCALHLFSARALDALRTIRQDEARLMVTHLLSSSSPAGVAVNLCAINVRATNALARAAIGGRMFGDGVGEGAREFKDMVVELMQLAGVLNIGDFVPALRWLDPQGVVAKMKRLHRRYDRMMDGFISERGQHAGEMEGNDLLSVMLATIRWQSPADAGEEDGIKFTEIDIKALLLNLFTAGTDTTSSTVEWALAELIRDPCILKQLQHELDGVV